MTHQAPRPLPRVAASTVISLLVSFLLLPGCGGRPGPATDAGASTAAPAGRPAARSLPQATLPDGAQITLELAITPEEVSQGLMFRPSLAADRGMLFLFAFDRVPSFWMKNTLIPLDLVFLDGEGRIVELIENVPPCAADPCPQYVPAGPARAVLEVAAGTVARHHLASGDRLQFERVAGYPAPAPPQRSDEG